MKNLGFITDFNAFDYEKTFHIYHHYGTLRNNQHVGPLSVEENLVALIYDKEQSLEECRHRYTKPFSFTEEGFLHLLEELRAHFNFVLTSQNGKNPYILVLTHGGSILIYQNGKIDTYGECINLFYMLRFSPIRQAFCGLSAK